MSFCNNNKPDRTPGLISGNPMTGLCERACIQVNKVFDACLKQISLENYGITVTDVTPAAPAVPLTFVSAVSSSSEGVISNLVVTPLAEPNKCSRVQATVTIPVEVVYVDANNVEGKGTATVSTNLDVIMYVPENSVIPVTFKTAVNVVAPQGVFVSGTTYDFTITACVTVVLKVEAEVELLVPTYGYCYIPPCNEYTQDVCSGVFDLPLFPTILQR